MIYVLAIIMNSALILAPFVLGNLIDALVRENNLNVLGPYIQTLILIYVIIFLTEVMLYKLSYMKSLRNNMRQRRQISEKIFAIPFDVFLNLDFKLQHLFSMDQINQLEAKLLIYSQFIPSLFMIIMLIIVMFYTNWLMTLVLIFFLPFIYFVSQFFRNKASYYIALERNDYDEMSSFLLEFMHNHKIMNIYHYDDVMEDKRNKMKHKFEKNNIKAQYFSSLINPSTRFVNHILYLVIALIGLYLMSNTYLSLGMLSRYLAYILMIQKPINELTSFTEIIMHGRNSEERVNKLLEIENDNKRGLEVSIESLDLEFNNLSFKYPNGFQAIEDLSLQLNHPFNLAIVGPSGAGKSTLINILLKFYPIDKGNVYFNEYSIKDMSQSSVRGHFSLVLQKPWVFEASFKDNILYGCDDVCDEKMIELCENLGILSFIESFPQGFDTVIEKDMLSMGEQQLISIARSLILDRPVYIMDEASSHLDPLYEYRLQNYLTTMSRNKSNVFIAHRMHTVVDADKILLMRDGKIDDVGTHDELFRRNRFYRHLFLQE